MKLKEYALAKSFAVVAGVSYIVCILFSIFFPKSLMYILNSWVHGVDLTYLAPPSGDWVLGTGNIYFGFPTFTVVAWILGFATAKLYNVFSKL